MLLFRPLHNLLLQNSSTSYLFKR